MMKSFIPFILFLWVIYAEAVAQRSLDARPNIILIMADDMGFECLSSNGSLSYSTPVLDKLGSEGMNFKNCYSQPLCTPSRVKIMTGRYNSNNYVDFGYLDKNEKTFGNLMKSAGYKTMIAGKWQLNGVNTEEPENQDMDRPHQFGFDEYCLWWFVKRGSRYAKPVINENGKDLKATIDDYGPDIVSNYVTNFIERNQDSPFFIYYPMLLVHAPYQPTPDSPEWRDLNTRTDTNDRYFKDMVEYTDKIVGKIMTKLEEVGLSENTIVLFVGDNGTGRGLTTLTKDGNYPGGKGSLKDNGNHVPLVVSWPARGKKDSNITDLVEFSDFLPTFAQAAQVSIPGNIDGKSFYNLIASQPYSPRETVFVHYYPNTQEVEDRTGCFVRNKEFKLYSDGRFYDMVNDYWEESPLDAKNLNPDQATSYALLKAELSTKNIWDFTVPHRVIK
ncbi:MAG: sulfatase-like hydrolase/transferase [Bacteroidota bacterium]